MTAPCFLTTLEEDGVSDISGGHIPVLLREVGELLSVRAGETVVDATVGGGGHARMLADAAGPSGRLIGLDFDPKSLLHAKEALANCPCPHDLIHANFVELGSVLRTQGVEGCDVILADLGISSAQLDDPSRGLSFQSDGPLDMRLDPTLTVKASDLINRLSEKELGDLFFNNAQEFKGRRIAKRICEARRDGRITTTARFTTLVCEALGVSGDSRRSKTHPATRAFLAMRIEVNRELWNLKALLESAPNLLKPGGRVGIIAFHSEEDKLVKADFRKRGNEGTYQVLTKKPVVAGEQERESNPRSRSAKLRVAMRVTGS